ncbi:hypothetical protein [Williamsia sp.]|uniref:hypothetical protein n=1 Tax=Williamsia sp. TaxID=1872085 RepID=UPI001A19EA49|nr:hypothetical protein [Williamsia sp.]MBJ7291220.1 hypothetical protein [Williamsia sp.]
MADKNSPSGPDDNPTSRMEPVGQGQSPSTAPIEGPTAYSATTPPPAEQPVATQSRWSRMRSQAGTKPWVPVTAVGVGAAIIGAVVASAVFLANPVHEDVSNASSSSALPASGGPGESGAPAAPGESGAPAAPDANGGPQGGPAGPDGKGAPDAKGGPGGPGEKGGPMCMPAPDGKGGPQGGPGAGPDGKDAPKPPAAGQGAPTPPAAGQGAPTPPAPATGK